MDICKKNSRYRRDSNETETENEEEGSAIGEEDIAEAEDEAALEVEAKAATEDDNYACVKAVAAGTVYRQENFLELTSPNQGARVIILGGIPEVKLMKQFGCGLCIKNIRAKVDFSIQNSG